MKKYDFCCGHKFKSGRRVNNNSGGVIVRTIPIEIGTYVHVCPTS